MIYLFLDLDDTLFQTRRKCPAVPLVTAAHGRDGTPLSFMTPKQRALWEWLMQGACVIPTTARNYDAYRRVALPFSGRAILDFGGVILTEQGQPDPEWDAAIRAQATGVKASLQAVHRQLTVLAAEHGLQTRTRVIGDFDMDLYVVSKQADIEAEDLSRLHALCAHVADPALFYVHFNDNNLSVIPHFLNKRYAVQYLLDHYVTGENAITLGMGDSLSDLAFMGICDYSILPIGSQLFTQLAEVAHV